MCFFAPPRFRLPLPFVFFRALALPLPCYFTILPTLVSYNSCSPGDLYDAPVVKSVPEARMLFEYNTSRAANLFACLASNAINTKTLAHSYNTAPQPPQQQKKAPLKQNLQTLARRAAWLILWLDCDREGENIGFEVLEVCRAANPRLTVRRARFSALIPR
jgi:hypothetical protein